MKLKLKRVILLVSLLFIPNLVFAESSCSYSEQAEINNIVANVKATYEVVDIYAGKVYDVDNVDENGNFPEVDHYIKGFNISILNITEDIYVKISNNYDGQIATFRYSDTKDGVATFQTTEVEDLATYTIEVYSNKYACAGELFRKFTITTPMYNLFSEWLECKENPDFYYCQEFLPSENISANEFNQKISEYKMQQEEEKKGQEENRNAWDKIKEFYQNNAVIINVLGAVIVVLGVTTTVILVKKRRSRVL